MRWGKIYAKRVFCPPDRYVIMKKKIDQRKHQRFKAKKGVYAAQVPGYACLGQIKDIGTNGLAFHYLAEGEKSWDSQALDIFTTNGKFFLKEVPCRLVADVVVEAIGSSDFLQLRKRHIEFEDMKPIQKNVLTSFIKNLTTQKA